MKDDNALTLALQIAEKLQPSLVTEVQYELAFDLLRLIRLVIYEDKNSLTAENKALREALERIINEGCTYHTGVSISTGVFHAQHVREIAEAALATKPTEGR